MRAWGFTPQEFRAEVNLATTLGPVTLAPPFAYLPASAEVVRIVAPGNPEGLQMRDIEGLVHVATRIPSLSAAQLDALSRLIVGDDRAATDILAPMHLQGAPAAVTPGQRSVAAELQAGPLIDAFGASGFGHRFLNTLNVLRIALDQLVTLEPLQNLAAAADPGSAMANALLTTALHRAQEQQTESNREWEVALREGWVQAEERLERMGMAYADSERSLTEARAEATRLQGSLDSASAECQEVQNERDVAWRDGFRALCDPQALVGYFVSMRLNGDATVFQEHVQAYSQRHTPIPHSVSLFVGRNSVPVSVPVPASGRGPGSASGSGSWEGPSRLWDVVFGPCTFGLRFRPFDLLRRFGSRPDSFVVWDSGVWRLRHFAVWRGRSGKDSHYSVSASCGAKTVPRPQDIPAKTPKHIFFDDLPDDEDGMPESLPQEVPQDDYEMGSGNAGDDDDQEKDLGNKDDEADVEILPESGSQPLLRLTPDGQHQVRPRVYTPQTDPKGLFYRAIDDDAEPPRSDEDLRKLLPADA
ncbi:hypothetical protein PHMEG_00031565 [Phytophthora megakarya]|uniref:Uncharacterized protein n=1 Tax=Phytophthora megakarya TaxID=4795 RepID=A0A225UXX1_9STRA|nr:hypothetical protein PHMEG_00031565 [Phytophthora megakarya]